MKQLIKQIQCNILIINFIQMIEQGNRTEQLIYRTSYRKHKERLADIRHNITANDFLPPRNHQSAKKHSFKDRIRKEDIDSANSYLKSKINAIKNRSNGKADELFSTEQLRKEPKRYFDQNNDVKIEINSEMNNGDNIKFVIPSHKNTSASFNMKIKESQKADITVAQTKMNSIQKTYKKFSSNSAIKDTERQVKTAKQVELFYNLPQRNENRVVVFKKTLIFSSMQSCLLELSLINERLLIAAYLMGLENSTLRQLYSIKRTNEILKECENNYEELCSRIYIQKNNDKYQFIRLIPKEEGSNEKQETSEDKNKQKAKIQTQFIKRNYYTLVKTDEEQKEEQKQKGPLYTFDHVQAIVERLAVPKRFFKFNKQQKSEKIDRVKAVSDYEKQPKSHQFSHEELARPEKKKMAESIKQSKESIKSKEPPLNISQKSSQQQLQKSNKKQSLQKISLHKSNLSVEKGKKEESNYQQLYEQQFDNPSQIKQSKLKSLEQSKLINSSIASNKSQELKTVKQSHKMEKKNESEVYQNQFQKQPEQQYDESFENNNESHSPVAKIANNPPPVQNVEEEYEEQFVE